MKILKKELKMNKKYQKKRGLQPEQAKRRYEDGEG
jgi:hypothetical protein